LGEIDALIARAQTMRQVLIESLACGCLTLESCAAIGWQHAAQPSERSTLAGTAPGNE
jgi:hypothetical protein